MSFSFLTETKIYSQKLKSKALKGFQALVSPKVTQQGYTPNSPTLLSNLYEPRYAIKY
ncbi:MAG: hypothetical protein V7L22_09510 [Nostoc sp.]